MTRNLEQELVKSEKKRCEKAPSLSDDRPEGREKEYTLRYVCAQQVLCRRISVTSVIQHALPLNARQSEDAHSKEQLEFAALQKVHSS